MLNFIDEIHRILSKNKHSQSLLWNVKLGVIPAHTKWPLQREGRQDEAHPLGAYDGTREEDSAEYFPCHNFLDLLALYQNQL